MKISISVDQEHSSKPCLYIPSSQSHSRRGDVSVAHNLEVSFIDLKLVYDIWDMKSISWSGGGCDWPAILSDHRIIASPGHRPLGHQAKVTPWPAGARAGEDEALARRCGSARARPRRRAWAPRWCGRALAMPPHRGTTWAPRLVGTLLAIFPSFIPFEKQPFNSSSSP
jgi:hypothetical protein